MSYFPEEIHAVDKRRGKWFSGLVAAALAVSVLGTAGPARAEDDVVSLTTCVDEVMTKGSSGACVLSLQNSLVAVGINVLVDGDFGEQTVLAVRGFQGGPVNLPVTGVADAATITALDKAANSPQPPSSGSAVSGVPDGTRAGENGVYKCGNFGNCTFYFSRRVTQEIHQVLNERDADLAAYAADVKLCVQERKMAAAACSAALVGGTWLLKGNAEKAVEQGDCLKVKFRAEIIPYRSGVDDSSSHCIDGDGS
ncbi:hypothetical protein FB565_007004 [Actinoplanes lutulentus]|uniref:Putative peptidoglycan binding protein n=1 Tax=Actinoplanes lutulentus TaxID=1287878 RepID=A0A327ZB28_9ACTN|nr:peptidoglycan-binding protein [Actinoplanes lutulentus]MBB2947236.1 hypothetical protein [Actinoplanes lutulentus]RAK36511.1 putative peptidoglycan binding protein [Actinoplanes lutulentus]